MKSVYLLLLFFLLNSFSAFHPVHLSVINLELKPDKEVIDISMRFFQEDFTEMLFALYHDEIFNGTFKSVDDSTLIEKYIFETFKIEIENIPVELKLTNKHVDAEDIWINFECKINTIPDSILVTNKLMLEAFNDQTNLLIFVYKNYEKGITFDSKTTKQLIDIKNIIEK